MLSTIEVINQLRLQELIRRILVYPFLEFTPYPLNWKFRGIDLLRIFVFYLKLQLLITKLLNQTLSSSMSFPVDLPLCTESNTQTDITVVTHILNIDEVASAFAEVGMQTTISCFPGAGITAILPQLNGNLIHEKQDLVLGMSKEKKYHFNELKNVAGDESNIKQLVFKTDDDSSDTDEFEETTDELLPDLLYSEVNNKPNMGIQKKIDQHSCGQVKEINNDVELINFEMSFHDEVSLQHDVVDFKVHESKDDTMEVSYEVHSNEPPDFQNPEEFEKHEVNEPPSSEILDETNKSTEPDVSNPNDDSSQEEKSNGDSDQDEKSNDDSNPNEKSSDELESNENTETSLKQNNCSCGSNALKKIADQLRNQAITIQLTPELLSSGINYEERVTEAINTTMSALQVEMAKLMDAFSDNQNIASTSCNCADLPLNSNDAVKIIVDEQRNTLQIKINQYTEIDELHVTHNSPGDHIEQSAVNVECECHPSHSGAAPPYSFAENDETYSSAKIIKPRSAIVPHYTASTNKSCCNKPSCSHSKIPTPLLQNRYSSVRAKRSENDTNQCKFDSKTCSESKTTGSIGVQTKLALGNRLQSESLNSIDHESCKRLWNNITLPLPGTYSIKSSHKSYTNSETSSNHIRDLQRCRSCRPYTELPWTDIVVPVSNTTARARSQPSCSCRNSLNTNKKEILDSTTPFITIKIRSPNFAQSQSCTNTHIFDKMSAKSTTSVPKVLNDTKTTISIKIVDQQNKEIIKEIAVEPGANVLTVNLDDIKAETEMKSTQLEKSNKVVELIEPQDSEPLVLGNEDTKNDDNVEDTEKNINSENEETQKDSDSLFAPAECVCADNIKLNTFKPDPVMLAMETCEAEMKPLRQALQELQMKVRNLNIPELKGCSCTLALEEHSKSITTISTGKPDPANIPHTEDPSTFNTYGPCSSFKPPMCYIADNNLPYGRLPPPTLTIRHPTTLNAPACCQSHYQDHSYHNTANKKKEHFCTCKKKKGSQKREKKEESYKKKKHCEVCTNTKNVHDKESETCMYISSMETNSPFVYKQSFQNSENNNSKYVPADQSSSFKMQSKETSSHCGSVCTDHEKDHKLKYDTIFHNTEKRKHKKRKQNLTHLKRSDLEALGPYHNVFDVQHLRLGQAVKTDPDDFLLPYNKSKLMNDFRSPHLVWSSIFSKTLSK